MAQTLNTSVSSTYTGMYEDLERYESGLPLDTFKLAIPRDDPRLVATRKELLPTLAAEYRTLTRSTKTIETVLKTRGIRYVLWDTEMYPEWDLSVFRDLKLVTESGKIRLYEFAE